MNRVLEKVFPAFKSHYPQPRTYYSYPEGAIRKSVAFRVVYNGTEAIEDGRIILFFAPSADLEPRFEAFELEDLRPIFSMDVVNILPGDVIEFESTEFSVPDALGFVPHDLSNFTNELYVQALINKNVNDPDPNTCVGNIYSKVTAVSAQQIADREITIVADQVVTHSLDLTSSEWIEHVSLKSELLSEYHKQDVYMTASIILPKGYHAQTNESTDYPTVYYIEGFTGTEAYATRAKAFLKSEMGESWQRGDWSIPMLRITLGSRFKFGHTSFADSETNGPWGTALTSEFIPFIETKYRAVKAAHGRFLHGHSSGGWSTLWLQLQFPDFFGGTWSSAPDPVDFSKFQLVNIYEADNAFWDPYGRPIPTFRLDGAVLCSMRDEVLIERVYGRGNGGQWDAFNAVFGPRDVNGMPIPLFDKLTGAIDPDVALYWERYDIVKFLTKHQDLLTTKLRGKIHVICGVEDNYYLDVACRSLQRIVGKKTKSDPDAIPACGEVANYVDMVPGDHTTIRNRLHYQQIYQEIAAVYKNSMQ